MARPKRDDSIKSLLETVCNRYEFLAFNQEKARNLLNYLIKKKAYNPDILGCSDGFYFNPVREDEAVRCAANTILLRQLGLSPSEISSFFKGHDRLLLISKINQSLEAMEKRQILYSYLIDRKETLLELLNDFETDSAGLLMGPA